MKLEHEGSTVEEAGLELKNERDLYKQCVQSGGEHQINSITTGMYFADSLSHSGHGIESERLLAKLNEVSL